MANKLAKLEDLKAAIDATTDGIDDLLTDLLESAAAMTERVVGVPSGYLRRQAGIVEYPEVGRARAELRLARRPIEAITEVKSLNGPGTDANFTEATALVVNTDYIIGSVELGLITRLSNTWQVGPRANMVTYTAGLADPDDAVGGDSIEPPEDLQRANIVQATMLFNLRKTAGIKAADAGGAQGQLGHATAHPMLIEAASRYRRVL